MTKQTRSTKRRFVLSLSLLTTTVLCALTFWISAIGAADRSKESVTSPWYPFGEVFYNMTLPSETAPSSSIRFVIFDNWDLLAERHEATSVKKFLNIHSPEVELYFGLTEEELSNSRKNPFMFFEFSLHPIIGPLMTVFPKGIETIPYAETPLATTFERMQFRGTVTRLTSDQVGYDLTMSPDDRPGPRFVGTLRGTRESPLPDAFSLTGWQYKPRPSFPSIGSVETLGELRKKLQAVKP
jgi:hypothetical protein